MPIENVEGSYKSFNLAPYEEITGILQHIELDEQILHLDLPSGQFKIPIGSYDLVSNVEEGEHDNPIIVSILCTPDSTRQLRVKIESAGDLGKERRIAPQSGDSN